MKLVNKSRLKELAEAQGLFHGTNNILEVDFEFEVNGVKFILDVDCYIVCDEDSNVEAIEFNVVSETLLDHEENQIKCLLEYVYKSLELC